MISKKIRELRENKGWTQKELSDKSGVSVSSIKTVEDGNIGEMSVFRRERVLLELSHTLGISVESLKEN